MAEVKQDQKKEKKDVKAEVKAEKPKYVPKEEKNEIIVRIFGYDILGSRNLYTGLTYIKGVSWAISNALLLKLKMPKSKKIGELTKDEIAKIEHMLRHLELPDFMKNRRFDPETAKTSHIYGSDLDIAREFDIKREKKIKSYRGFRHTYSQPVRGQRTKSHFRKKGQGAGGIKKKKEAAKK